MYIDIHNLYLYKFKFVWYDIYWIMRDICIFQKYQYSKTSGALLLFRRSGKADN